MAVKPNFDRIRPSVTTDDASVAVAREDDHLGKRRLFSEADQPPTTGSVSLVCTRCEGRSVVSLLRLARLSLSGVHIGLPGVGHRAWLRCPACEEHAWVTVSMKK